MTALLWLSQFIIECSGAFFASRRRLWSLWGLLTFLAFSDAIEFLLRNTHPAYGYALWGCVAGQYAIMCSMAVQIVGRWVRENRRLTPYAFLLGSGAMLLSMRAFLVADNWMSSFLDAEISASCSLALILLLGWISRKKPLEGLERGVAAGLIISIAGNAACAWAWEYWPFAAKLFPIPALVALGVWNMAAWRDYRCEEARLPLGMKKPCTSVLTSGAWQRRIM